MNNSTVTIPLEEYEKLKRFEDTYLDKVYAQAREIAKDWNKSEILNAALKKYNEMTEENRRYDKKSIDILRQRVDYFKKLIDSHNKKLFSSKIVYDN